MPLRRGQWMLGPSLGPLRQGTVVKHLEDDRLGEEWRFHDRHEAPGFRGAVLAPQVTTPPWVAFEVVERGESPLIHFDRLRGVPLAALRVVLGEKNASLPIDAACFIGAQLARGLASPPAPGARVCPHGLWVGWDGAVQLLAWPISVVPQSQGSLNRDSDARFLDAPNGVANVAEVLAFVCGELKGFPADVTQCFERVLAPGSPASVALAALSDALERHASSEWLRRELPELFPVERVTEQSFDRDARREHPDSLPQELLDRAREVEDDAAFAVVADALLAGKRPRGQLAVVQTRRALGWELEAETLLKTWPELSPLSPDETGVTLEWRAGWVVGITVSCDLPWPRFHRLLDHPASIFCRRLSVTGPPPACAAALQTLQAERFSLERLELAHGLLEARLKLADAAPGLAVEAAVAAPAPTPPYLVPEPAPGIFARLRNVLLRRPR